MEGNDLDLIQRTLQGDINAWGEIVNRYKQRVFGTALGIVRNPEDAKDIVQDTFLKAYEKLETYDIKRKFSPWLLTIAANLGKNKLRKDKFLHRLKNPMRLEGPKVNDPQREIAKEEKESKVRKALNNLPAKYRLPIVLRYYGDLSYKEISDALSIPEGTVKTRLHRAKTKMENQLRSEHCYE